MYATRSVTKRTGNMADEPTTPRQQGGDGEEASNSQLMPMMMQLQASFENTRRSFDNRVTEVADQADDLAEETSALRDQTSALRDQTSAWKSEVDGRLDRLERDESACSLSNDTVDVARKSTPLAAPLKVGNSIVRQRAPRYDGTSKWEAYLAQFEITAELNGWTSPEKADFLATSMDGSAANILGAIPADRRKDYSELVTALETRFGCSVQKELNLVRLRNHRRQRGGPLVEVADDVERLARLTYADASSDTQNIHAMEQFIEAICDDDLRVRVLQSRPTNLQEALRSALELESYTLAVRRTPTVRAMESVPDNNTVSDINQIMEEVVARFSAAMTKQLGNMRSGTDRECLRCVELVGTVPKSGTTPMLARKRVTDITTDRCRLPRQTRTAVIWHVTCRTDRLQDRSSQVSLTTCGVPMMSLDGRQRSGNDRQPISRGGGRSTVDNN